jgi:hypothetical protein
MPGLIQGAGPVPSLPLPVVNKGGAALLSKFQQADMARKHIWELLASDDASLRQLGRERALRLGVQDAWKKAVRGGERLMSGQALFGDDKKDNFSSKVVPYLAPSTAPFMPFVSRVIGSAVSAGR